MRFRPSLDRGHVRRPCEVHRPMEFGWQSHIAPASRAAWVRSRFASAVRNDRVQHRRRDMLGERLDERTDLIGIAQSQRPVEGPVLGSFRTELFAARANEHAPAMLDLYQSGPPTARRSLRAPRLGSRRTWPRSRVGKGRADRDRASLRRSSFAARSTPGPLRFSARRLWASSCVPPPILFCDAHKLRLPPAEIFHKVSTTDPTSSPKAVFHSLSHLRRKDLNRLQP